MLVDDSLLCLGLGNVCLHDQCMPEKSIGERMKVW